jgi:hypothetical protein
MQSIKIKEKNCKMQTSKYEFEAHDPWLSHLFAIDIKKGLLVADWYGRILGVFNLMYQNIFEIFSIRNDPLKFSLAGRGEN